MNWREFWQARPYYLDAQGAIQRRICAYRQWGGASPKSIWTWQVSSFGEDICTHTIEYNPDTCAWECLCFGEMGKRRWHQAKNQPQKHQPKACWHHDYVTCAFWGLHYLADRGRKDLQPFPRKARPSELNYPIPKKKYARILFLLYVGGYLRLEQVLATDAITIDVPPVSA